MRRVRLRSCGLGLVAAALGLAPAGVRAAPARPVAEAAGAVSIERLDPRFDRLVPPGATAEVVATGFGWAEGPVWDPRHGALLVSDVPNNVVRRWTPAGGLTTFLEASGHSGPAGLGGPSPGSNGLALDAEGRLVLCQHGERRLARREADGTLTVLADRYRGRRLNSPNDLVIRPNGDTWFTDPPFGLPNLFLDPARELSFQGVFRLAADGTLTAMVTDLDAPNGLGFSPDGRTLYVANADNRNPVWMAYPVRDDGTVGPGRRFAEARSYVRPGEGACDGLKVDADGHVWATGPGGIHVFAPDGTRLGRIVTGRRTGNLAFGEDGAALYIAADHDVLRMPIGGLRPGVNAGQ
jgi:gluconolactonase